MKITRKDIVAMVGMIKANYTYAYKDVTKPELSAMVEFWFTSLAKYEKEVVNVAFQRAVESCTFPPTLADIIQNVKAIKAAAEPTDEDCWEELVRVLPRVGRVAYFGTRQYWDNGRLVYPAEELQKIYDGLPPILKAYVGGVSELVSLAKQETLEYEKGRFLKALPTLKQRDEIKQTIHPNILRLAKETAKELQGSVDLMLLKDTEQSKK